MNRTNEKIIEILTADARTPIEDIAKMTGEKPETVAAAIENMEASGVIVKYTTVIDEERAAPERVNALIEVKVAPVKSKGFDSLARYISQFPEVKGVYLMSGGFDLAVFIEGRNLKEVARFVSDKLSAMESVLSTATHFILKKYKAEGVEFERETGSRLIVQP